MLSQQKVEIGAIKNRIEAVKTDPEKINIMNQVKELDISNAELIKHEKKLLLLNDFQYDGLVKESLQPNEAYRQEMNEREIERTAWKTKHKKLIKIKDSKMQTNKDTFN